MKKKIKKVNKKIAVKSANGFYKGYDMNWLRKETQHPDYKLVAEFDAIKE